MFQCSQISSHRRPNRVRYQPFSSEWAYATVVDTQITVLEILVVSVMHGGVIPFRGTGADARRYVEADRSRADDYYLGEGTTVAEFAVIDGAWP